jgi:hypothetical protein
VRTQQHLAKLSGHPALNTRPAPLNSTSASLPSWAVQNLARVLHDYPSQSATGVPTAARDHQRRLHRHPEHRRKRVLAVSEIGPVSVGLDGVGIPPSRVQRVLAIPEPRSGGEVMLTVPL